MRSIAIHVVHWPWILAIIVQPIPGFHSDLVSIAHAVQAGETQATATASSDVLAYLGEQSITRGEVDFQLLRRSVEASDQPLPPLPAAVLQSTLDLIAQQRQALQTLRMQKLAVRREEVERWIAERMQSASDQPLPAAELIRRGAELAGISETAYREHFTFRLSWQRYLQLHLTDKNVHKHFDNQQGRFDGTRFRIASVAIVVPAGASSQRTDAHGRLDKLRHALMDATIDWQDLQQASKAQRPEPLAGLAPERVVLSDERWIRGMGYEHPAIVTELLKLEAPAISTPIDTPTAVYLVKLLEIETGTLALPEVRDEVRADMLIYLLDHLAHQSRELLPLRAEE